MVFLHHRHWEAASLHSRERISEQNARETEGQVLEGITFPVRSSSIYTPADLPWTHSSSPQAALTALCHHRCQHMVKTFLARGLVATHSSGLAQNSSLLCAARQRGVLWSHKLCVGSNEVVRQVWIRGESKSHLSEMTSALQGLDWSLLNQIGNLSPGNESGNLKEPQKRRHSSITSNKSLYGALHSEVKPKACFILKARAFCNLPSFMQPHQGQARLNTKIICLPALLGWLTATFPFAFSPGFFAFITTNAAICATTSSTRQAKLEATSFSCGKQISH